jgi:uncharacterized protein (DUF58 family)
MTPRLAPPWVTANARAGRRLAFGLTPRAFLFLAAGLLWIGPAWIDRRAIGLLAIWDLLVIALVFVNLRRLPSPDQLVVTRSWSGPVSMASSADVEIDVRNLGAASIQIRLTDYVNGQLRRELPDMTLAVPAGGSARTSYDVTPRERGDQLMGVAAMQWRDAWGLVERWGVAPLEQTVRVYPNLQEGLGQARYLVRSRQVTLEKRRAKRYGAGREFDRLRDHRPGDERRDVCWSASARRGKLVTKVYQPERSQTVWLLVDAGRLLRARVKSPVMAEYQTLLDTTVAAALALAQVALASGDRVGLLAYGRRLQHRVAPARGASHLRRLVEALAVVRADGVEADHAAAATTVLSVQKRRALIVWLTDVAETAGVPDVIERALHMAPAHVVLFAVPRQPDIVALAAATPDTPAEMYRVMSAHETLERRESLLRRLQQRGALVLEVSPAELSSGLVDRYLEVKERGLL